MYAAATLVIEQEVRRSVLVMAGAVFSFERIDNVLVGSHSSIADDALRDVIQRLDLVVDEWRQAGLTILRKFNTN